ncbi:MAG: FecR domain-containing protein [Bacteroidota bacterium]
MDQLKHILLYLRGKNEELSKSEQTALESWLEREEHQQSIDEADAIWRAGGRYQASYEPDVEAGLQRFKAAIQKEKVVHQPVAKQRRLLSRSWSIAAALVLALGIAVVYKSFLPTAPPQPVVLENTADEPKVFQLPDGTLVTLNGNSQLTYLPDFEKNDLREVTLSGEGYFQVVADPQHPFHIHTPEARVEVMGTAFNLRAYPNEVFTEVEVEEGIVNLMATQLDKQMKKLVANERATLMHGEGLVRKQLNTTNANSWKTGRLKFRKEQLSEVINVVERHYGVTINYDRANLGDCSLNTNFKEATIEEVLKTFEVIFEVKTNTTDPDTYQLTGGGC